MSATFKESENEKAKKYSVNYGNCVKSIGVLGTILVNFL